MAITIKTRVRPSGPGTQDNIRTHFTAPTAPDNLLAAAAALIQNHSTPDSSHGYFGHSWLEIDGQPLSLVALTPLVFDESGASWPSGEPSALRYAANLIDQCKQRADLGPATTSAETPRDKWIVGSGLTQEGRRYLVHTQHPRFFARIVQLDELSGLPMPFEEPVIAEGPFSFATKSNLFCEVTAIDGPLEDLESFRGMISQFASHVDTASSLIEQSFETENDALKKQLLNAGDFAAIAVSVQYALAKQILLNVLGNSEQRIFPSAHIADDLGADDTHFRQIRALLTRLDIFLPPGNDDSLTVQDLANMMFPLTGNSTPGLRQ